MVHVYSNVKNSRRDTQQVPVKNCGEAGVAENGQDMGYTGGRVSSGSGTDVVGGNLNWTQTEDGGSVSGTVPYI